MNGGFPLFYSSKTGDDGMHENFVKHQFKPGDPRINRAGRPKTFDTLRELAQQIALEEVDGIPRIEKILRNWADGSERQQLEFLTIAYGKPPANTAEEVERGPMRLTIDMRSPGEGP